MVSNTLGTAFATIGDQVTKLILGTVTWGEALANIGRNILTQLVQSMVQFFVNLIARQILTAVIGTGIAAAQAAAMSSAWAGPAVLASIASYGAAAEVGPAAVTAALASAPAIAALGAAAGYEQGGFTGVGPRDEVAGVVHRGEFVVPASVVQRVGLGRLGGFHGEPRFLSFRFGWSLREHHSDSQLRRPRGLPGGHSRRRGNGHRRVPTDELRRRDLRHVPVSVGPADHRAAGVEPWWGNHSNQRGNREDARSDGP